MALLVVPWGLPVAVAEGTEAQEAPPFPAGPWQGTWTSEQGSSDDGVAADGATLDVDWSIGWACTVCICPAPPWACIYIILDVRVRWTVTACSDAPAALEWVAAHPYGVVRAATGAEEPAGVVVLNGPDGQPGSVGPCHSRSGSSKLTGGNCIAIQATLTPMEGSDPTAAMLHDEGLACYGIPVCFRVQDLAPEVDVGAWPCIP